MKEAIEKGQLKPYVEKVFNVTEISAAMDYAMTSCPKGKIGIDVNFSD